MDKKIIKFTSFLLLSFLSLAKLSAETKKLEKLDDLFKAPKKTTTTTLTTEQKQIIKLNNEIKKLKKEIADIIKKLSDETSKIEYTSQLKGLNSITDLGKLKLTLQNLKEEVTVHANPQLCFTDIDKQKELQKFLEDTNCDWTDMFWESKECGVVKDDKKVEQFSISECEKDKKDKITNENQLPIGKYTDFHKDRIRMQLDKFLRRETVKSEEQEDKTTEVKEKKEEPKSQPVCYKPSEYGGNNAITNFLNKEFPNTFLQSFPFVETNEQKIKKLMDIKDYSLSSEYDNYITSDIVVELIAPNCIASRQLQKTKTDIETKKTELEKAKDRDTYFYLKVDDKKVERLGRELKDLKEKEKKQYKALTEETNTKREIQEKDLKIKITGSDGKTLEGHIKEVVAKYLNQDMSSVSAPTETQEKNKNEKAETKEEPKETKEESKDKKWEVGVKYGMLKKGGEIIGINGIYRFDNKWFLGVDLSQTTFGERYRKEMLYQGSPSQISGSPFTSFYYVPQVGLVSTDTADVRLGKTFGDKLSKSLYASVGYASATTTNNFMQFTLDKNLAMSGIYPSIYDNGIYSTYINPKNTINTGTVGLGIDVSYKLGNNWNLHGGISGTAGILGYKNLSGNIGVGYKFTENIQAFVDLSNGTIYLPIGHYGTTNTNNTSLNGSLMYSF